MASFCSVLLFFQLTKLFPKLWCSLFASTSHLVSSFQVREVRVSYFKRIFPAFGLCYISLVIVWCLL